MSNWPPQGQVYSDYALPASKVCTHTAAPCDFSVESACMLHAGRTSCGHALSCVNISSKMRVPKHRCVCRLWTEGSGLGRACLGCKWKARTVDDPDHLPLSVHDRMAPTRRRVWLEAARRISCQDWLTKEICRHIS